MIEAMFSKTRALQHSLPEDSLIQTLLRPQWSCHYPDKECTVFGLQALGMYLKVIYKVIAL